MRYWRNISFDQGLPSPSFNTGLKLWAFAARTPALYRFGTAIATRAMRILAGSRARLKSLPIMKGWFAARDLPKPASASFQTQWRRGKRP
jgi:L-lactate dehydrogenase complex protein LldF